MIWEFFSSTGPGLKTVCVFQLLLLSQILCSMGSVLTSKCLPSIHVCMKYLDIHTQRTQKFTILEVVVKVIMERARVGK